MQTPEPMAPAFVSELSPAWRAWGRGLAMLAAVTFALAAVLILLDQLHVIVPEPRIPDGTSFPDRLITILGFESRRFGWVLLATVISTVSFAALAALGAVVRRLLGGSDPRGSFLVGAFALGGALGVVGQIAFAGGQAVASNPTYCQCEFADPQVIARGELLDLVSSMQTWMLSGLIVSFGVGLLLAASLGRDSGGVPAGWLRLSTWLGALMIVAGVLALAVPPLFDTLRVDVDAGLVTGVPTLAVLLVLIPWWALWLRGLLGSETSSG